MNITQRSVYKLHCLCPVAMFAAGALYRSVTDRRTARKLSAARGTRESDSWGVQASSPHSTESSFSNANYRTVRLTLRRFDVRQFSSWQNKLPRSFVGSPASVVSECGLALHVEPAGEDRVGGEGAEHAGPGGAAVLQLGGEVSRQHDRLVNTVSQQHVVTQHLQHCFSISVLQ